MPWASKVWNRTCPGKVSRWDSSTAKPIYQQFANHVPTIIVITAIYVVINLLLTLLATWIQRRFVGEKKVLEVAMVGQPQSDRTVI